MAIIHDYTIFIPYYTYTRRWINWAIRHAADLIFLVVILLGWWVIFTISNRNSYQTTSLKSPCFMVNSPNFGWTSCTIKSSHVGIMFLIHLQKSIKLHHKKSTLVLHAWQQKVPRVMVDFMVAFRGARATFSGEGFRSVGTKSLVFL